MRNMKIGHTMLFVAPDWYWEVKRIDKPKSKLNRVIIDERAKPKPELWKFKLSQPFTLNRFPRITSGAYRILNSFEHDDNKKLQDNGKISENKVKSKALKSTRKGNKKFWK